MEPYPSGPRRRDRLIAHVYAADGRHVQVALYGWGVAEEKGRRVARWETAVYADTEEPLAPADEDRWRDDLAAAISTRAAK